MSNRGGGTTDTPFLRNYRLGKTLGHGSFGKVKVAEHLLTGHKVAIKILNRRKMKTPDMEEKLRREIKICRLFVHPHVIRLYEVIETPSDIYVVMEYVKSGELFDYIVEKGRLQEDEARHFFQQIIAGVEYCHRNRVVHRDLKPENLLLDARGNVKIADFGLSNIMRDGHFLKTSCGSPNYAAPEVVSGKLYAGPEVDVWSCGVILYALLCGTLPFDDENIPNLFKKIKSGLYTLPSHLSALARDLIPRMLIVDPMKRIAIADIRQHQWFKIRLPRYLAVPPPDAMQHLKKLDEEILQQVTRMGFDRDQLLESLQKRIQDDATVAYYLLYDNRSFASSGYLGAEFQESMDGYSPGLFPNLDLQLSTGNGISQEASLRHPFSKEKKWLVGLQSPANPREIMNQVLGTLQELNVRWKKIGHYNMKCLWCHDVGLNSMASNHMNDDHFISNAVAVSTHLQPQTAVKFEMQWLSLRKDEDGLGNFSAWNITGTYRGSWKFLNSKNSTTVFPDFSKSNGNSVLELISTPTKITGVHYVQGLIIFHDVFDNEHGGAQIRVEGVYVWPFRQLRLIAYSGKEGEFGQEDDYLLSNPYHLLGLFSSQIFQESPRDKMWKRKHSPMYEMEKHCNIEIAAQISHVSSSNNDGDHDHYHLEGLMESPSADDGGDCFSSMLLNATSVNIDVYYNKAVNYTLMVTFVSFLQVLLLIRQMEHGNTQSGMLVESLFNAFATAVFFKFVVFSIFEMRYLLAVWKASRPMNSGEGWEAMRRELSILYSRFYGILLGGILIMYEFHKFLRPLLLLLHSFWIPQIVTNVICGSRKPLHPHYILGMTITRLAIPLYVFGCPHNFMRIEPDKNWCVCLGIFMALQASILLLQHYLRCRWFIPREILPEKYSYYRRFDQDADHATDCVICMTAINLTQRANHWMVTPCDHFFHSGCLQRWMDIKMECPTCRRPLPPA